MEAAYGTAGNGDEEARENGLAGNQTLILAEVAEPVPEFRQAWPLDEQAHQKGNGHKKQGGGKNRINPPHKLVYGQYCSEYVIKEDNAYPAHHGIGGSVAGYVSQQDGGTVHKHRTHQHQYQQREAEHHGLGGFPEVLSYELGKTCAVIAERKHTAEVVVDRSGKYAAEHHPEVGGRSELRAHNGSEYRSRAGNVQELDHINLPARHCDEIHTVGLGYCRGDT